MVCRVLKMLCVHRVYSGCSEYILCMVHGVLSAWWACCRGCSECLVCMGCTVCMMGRVLSAWSVWYTECPENVMHVVEGVPQGT